MLLLFRCLGSHFMFLPLHSGHKKYVKLHPTNVRLECPGGWCGNGNEGGVSGT